MADLLLWNFTSSFSLSSETHSFTRLDKGASHTDPLLYLFSYTKYNGKFIRGDAEDRAKDFMVSKIIKYVYGKLERWNGIYEYCDAAAMKLFCDFIQVERKRNGNILVSIDFDYDLWTIPALDKVSAALYH